MTSNRNDNVIFRGKSGAWAPFLATQIDLSLPIEGRRHQLLLARPTSPLPADLPWLIDPVHQVHLRPDLDGRALVGGLWETAEAASSAEQRLRDTPVRPQLTAYDCLRPRIPFKTDADLARRPASLQTRRHMELETLILQARGPMIGQPASANMRRADRRG